MTDRNQPDTLVSVPHLLARNARLHADQPAYREKEFGIWQSWTWYQTAKEVEALALGLIDLGVSFGDHVAVIGRNRPALYWSMVAIQSVGAVPVPLYQDAVVEEMTYVLENCSARFVIAGDQEQVDKIIEAQDTVTGIEHVIYFDTRGMRKYDHGEITAFADVQKAALFQALGLWTGLLSGYRQKR